MQQSAQYAGPYRIIYRTIAAMPNVQPNVLIRRFEQVDYLPCWEAMKAFTDQRGADSVDELWLLEHPAVFTLGQAGKPEHVLAAGDIPVVKCDRGGQVTYHGPGQTVIYLMIDIQRLGIGTRELVSRIEQAIINMLSELGISATNNPTAPGVYVDGAKIAQLGLRIRHGRSYHGLSINRDMIMEHFRRINPCGYAGQPITSLAMLGLNADRQQCELALLDALQQQFRFDQLIDAQQLPDWYNLAKDSANHSEHTKQAQD
tara:strand:- start:13401 stop:14177 length:777 start_codon:yes stop_codon:yes gene_type:complete